MFEITGDDIAKLKDADLRTLVARLCEAELHRAGLPVSGVTAGGHQDAPDGGLDVRVEGELGADLKGFVSRHVTGFQVKVPDMPRGEILKEMRPKGQVRPVIQELAVNSGAYIIVSSSGSTADGPLQSRRKAMRDAVKGIRNVSKLKTDFYDRDRVATWVRSYPSVTHWVREKIGKPLLGWQAYQNWSCPSEGIEAEYLLDDHCSIFDRTSTHADGVNIEEGINRMRAALSRPGQAVRLIGLSGLGKTRLVQALFDQRVGEAALDPSLVHYTDIADEPDPSPRDVLLQLTQSEQRAILVVDNCKPDLHRALAKSSSTLDNSVSVLTVEYDITDDEPESTEVFRLEAVSDELIENLVHRRAPHVSQVDRRRMAEFSGGNARMALALANTVKQGESVSNLSDPDLFNRLFHQHHAPDDNLLRAAEACALVYSLDGETVEGDGTELSTLSKLSGMSISDLYRHIGELKARGLVQRRSKWRAILPHALANKLAHQALERLIPEHVNTTMCSSPSEHLLKSFSRRLGYLHDCDGANKIVRGWLAEDGFLANIGNLSPLGLDMFNNIAPVDPDETLNAIERALDGEWGASIISVENRKRHRIASLLRSVAYEPDSFKRAVMLLSRFVIAEPENYNSDSTRRYFKDLFQLRISGTHALIDQRIEVVRALLSSEDELAQKCGFDALNALLEARRFSSSNTFSFGTRSRNYGWHPETKDEVAAWYRTALGLVMELVATDGPTQSLAKNILALRFSSLWSRVFINDELEEALFKIASNGFWPKGWVSVRQAIHYHAKEMAEDDLQKLNALEEMLRPKSILDQARVYVVQEASGAFDIVDAEIDDDVENLSSVYERAEMRAETIGKQVAQMPDILEILAPEITRGKVGRAWSFGKGLALKAENLATLWGLLTSACKAAPEDDRNINVLRGFLFGAQVSNPDQVSNFLDGVVADPDLGQDFPLLQTAVDIDPKGVERLISSIELGQAPAYRYSQLFSGKIPGGKLSELLTSLTALQNGLEVAIDVLYMRHHLAQDAKEEEFDQDLVVCGRKMLLQCTYQHGDNLFGHKLADVAKFCLEGADGRNCAQNLCEKMAKEFSEASASPYNYGDLLAAIFEIQPMTALDAFLSRKDKDIDRWFLRESLSGRDRPLEGVPMDVLLKWAHVDPDERFPTLAAIIRIFVTDDSSYNATLSPRVLELLDTAPNKSKVLSEYECRLSPTSYSGSRADILEARRVALQELSSQPDPVVKEWLQKCDVNLAKQAHHERKSEMCSDESFE